jgi:hypothetical protein
MDGRLQLRNLLWFIEQIKFKIFLW